MAEIWKSKSQEVLSDWIDACMEVADDLTKWEYDFILSISDQLQDRGTLSQKQQEILERIYAERTK